MISDEFYEYDYLDSKTSELREKTLKEFIENKNETQNLCFYDLDFYLNEESIQQKIKKVINKSLYDNKVCLSESQIEILDILENKNLFLSAPTSFGKTFIVLEFLKRHPKFNNIVFIVPTLALLNELLKKIFNNFGIQYNICINAEEKIADKNIFIFVPERSDYTFISKINQIGLDLVVFDEIYKLKPKNKKELNSDDRIITMNKVYLNLLNSAKKIILLGPFIREITFENTKLDIVKYYTNMSPVYNYVHCLDNKNWIDYMGGDKELVYFNNPEGIYNSLDLIISKFSEDDKYIKKYSKEIEYLENNVYKDWYAIKLLKRGIGIHHGKTPMFLRKFYEDEYNEGELKCLLCTSTLMEGINTPTMRLLVVCDPGNVFSLNNLIGRVGRLNVNHPKSGDVFLFDKKSCENFKNRNKWETLKILAEDTNTLSDDEVLFLNKKYNKSIKQNEYEEKLNLILKEGKKTINEIRMFDIRVRTAYKFIKNEFRNKFLNASSVKECVVLTYDLFGRIPQLFRSTDFEGISYSIDTLPYYDFTKSLIMGKSINQIISGFEVCNGKLSIRNTNLLIDRLLQLRTIIKFKLSKIVNYLNLYDVKYSSNDYLKMFVLNIENFGKLKISDKILEDLGIEEKDYNKLNEYIPQNENISTSDVIKYLRNNKEKIDRMQLSPFTKRSIRKI